MLDEQHSEYSGIGSSIANYDRDGVPATYIIATAPNGPSHAAGLKYGDRIVAVDGEAMAGMAVDVVREKVRGPAGSSVRLTIEHASTGKTTVIELRRSRLYQPSVPDAYLLGGGVGYIDLTTGFNFSTADELDAALKRLKSEGMTSLILDLRGNPGGILDQAIKVAERFLPAGTVVVSQRGRFQSDNRVWLSKTKIAETMPVILMVDENSASASEVVAGALQDHNRALIVGEKTFGKGLVQNLVDLPAGAGLTITTARYFTPSGRSIQRDYSNGSMYDYYNHKGNSSVSSDGITPDDLIPAPKVTGFQSSLADALFYFSVVAVSQQIPGLERLSDLGPPVRTPELPARVGSEVVERFIAFARKSGIIPEQHQLSEADYRHIAVALQYNIAAAHHGTAAAARVRIANDPQVSAAIGSIPKARQLAASSFIRRVRK